MIMMATTPEPAAPMILLSHLPPWVNRSAVAERAQARSAVGLALQPTAVSKTRNLSRVSVQMYTFVCTMVELYTTLPVR